MEKIIIDLQSILEPFKLAAIISKYNREYDKILIPDSFKIIEIGLDKLPPESFEIFSDSDFSLMERSYNHWGKTLVQDNFFLGLELLKIAESKGMIDFFDADKYGSIGRKILTTQDPYPLFYWKNTPANRILRIHPDWAYTALDSIIGAQATFSSKAIISDQNFSNYVRSRRPKGTIYGEEGNIGISSELLTEFQLPQVDSIEQLFELAINNKLVRHSFLKNISHNQKQVMLMSLEFGSTVTADTFLFGGIPISSGVLFGYKVIKNLFFLKKD